MRGAAGQVVGRAHADLVARDVRCGKIEHRELTDREGPVCPDAAHRRGVVQRFDVGGRVGQDGGERRPCCVAVNGDRNVGREYALAESAEHARLTGPAGRLDDLERRVIGVCREHQCALRRAGRNARMNLPERVGLR